MPEKKEKAVKRCCFTGYRPSKFPFELSGGNGDYDEFLSALESTIFSLYEKGCSVFYTGMAMGFDIIAAETVVKLKRCGNSKISLICAVPFKGQGNAYPDDWKERYNNIIKSSDETVVLSQTYYGGCYFKRNHFMVDNCDYVLTWYDGKRGGTMETLNYAAKKGREIINIYPQAQLSIF